MRREELASASDGKDDSFVMKCQSIPHSHLRDQSITHRAGGKGRVVSETRYPLNRDMINRIIYYV